MTTLPSELAVTHDPSVPTPELGQFGDIVMCVDDRTGQQVVVRVNKKASMGVHESDVLQRLKDRGPSRHIIALVKHALTNSLRYGRTSFLVMERAVGREWYASIDPKAEPPGGPQPEAVALPLFRQAVEGLRFMHQMGVAHLDIKLENIMIKDDGTLIFIDFGLASTSGGLLREQRGTPGYMSPEVYAWYVSSWVAQPYDGYLADVWSLGICFFTIIAGGPPVRGAVSTDRHFEKLHTSGVRGWFEFVSQPCTWSTPLLQLVDGMLAVSLTGPTARLTADALAALPLLLPTAPAAPAAPAVAPSAPAALAPTMLARGETGETAEYPRGAASQSLESMELAADAAYLPAPQAAALIMQQASSEGHASVEDFAMAAAAQLVLLSAQMPEASGAMETMDVGVSGASVPEATSPTYRDLGSVEPAAQHEATYRGLGSEVEGPAPLTLPPLRRQLATVRVRMRDA